MLVLEVIEVCLNGLSRMDFTYALGLHHHRKGKEHEDRRCWVKRHLDLVYKMNVGFWGSLAF